MKIQLTAITESFPLSFDPSGKATVTIRQAKTGAEIHLGQLFSKQRRIWDDEEFGPIKLETDWNFDMMKRERVFLTICGLDLEDENSKPIMKFKADKRGNQILNMTKLEFYEVWDNLSVKYTDEIYEHVLRVNPQWNPNAEGE